MAVQKIRPKAELRYSWGDDGRAPERVYIEYYCQKCGRYAGGYKSFNACDECGTFYDWGDHEPRIKTVKIIEW